MHWVTSICVVQLWVISLTMVVRKAPVVEHAVRVRKNHASASLFGILDVTFGGGTGPWGVWTTKNVRCIINKGLKQAFKLRNSRQVMSVCCKVSRIQKYDPPTHEYG